MDLATWAGVAVAFLTGLAGVIVGGLAIATSKKANALAEKTAQMQTEVWHVDWKVDWNDASHSVVLRQRGSDPAHDVVVTITGDDDSIHIVDRPGTVNDGTDAVVLAQVVHDVADQGWSVHVDVHIAWRTGLGKADEVTKPLVVA